MRISLQRTLLFIISVCAFMPSHSQVKRVTTCNPMTPEYSTYDIVYEYDSVDEQPQFPGGERGLTNFINRIREYPYSAYARKIEGRVLCSFIINPDGSISNIRVIKGVESTLNKEALRIITSMPNWKAGKIDHENVPVHCILPIAFRL
ncbi:MAG: energy transducer TonB [Muribaculaceae bacterium]